MKDIVVKKYKGNRKAERGIRRMTKRGYEVQAQSSRKALWRWYCGIFTRSQIHTVTFARAAAAER
jgi:hypothetical protein